MLNEFYQTLFILVTSSWLICLFFGIISIPLSRHFFVKYEDYGFNIGKIIGLFFVSYISFLIVTISSKLPIQMFQVNSIVTFFVSLILYSLIQFVFFKEHFIIAFKNFQIKKILKYEIIFIFIISIFTFLNLRFGLTPFTSEALMNIGILRTLENSNSLPIKDFWLSGENINYYYFGHYVFYQFRVLSQIEIELLYFSIAATIPALLGTASYVFITKFTNNYRFLLVPILFFLTPLTAIYEYFFAPIDKLKNVGIDYLFYLLSIRPIPNAITENFSYTFTHIPIHAHVFSLLISLVLIYQLFNIYEKKDLPNVRNENYVFYFLLLGLTFITNTWDFLFYLGVICIATFINYFSEIKKNWKSYIVNFEILTLLSISITLPWYLFYNSPSIGISFVKEISSIIEFLSFWQIYLFVFIAYYFIFYFKKQKFNLDLFSILILYCLSILVIMEIIYFKDSTLQRWNTYYKFSNQIILIFTLLSTIFLSRILEFPKLYLLKALFIIIICLSSIGFGIYILEKTSYTDNTVVFKTHEKIFFNNPFKVEAYNYLKEYSKNSKIILTEYPGEVYKDSSLFAPLLGIENILGWENHEYTWRYGTDLSFQIAQRKEDIVHIYTSNDSALAKRLLKKYESNIVIVGPSEKYYLLDLNEKKFLEIGDLIFSNEEINIYQVE